MHHIAIFASGTGSNARKIVEYFENHQSIKVSLIVSNKPSAKVLELATEYNIPKLIINRKEFYEGKNILEKFSIYHIDFIVLAGFLLLIPQYLVRAYENRIVNIHPALLPKYGGKGMYGMNVHRSVYAAKEKESGITIHFVNEHYDEGAIIFQASCKITPEDSPENIAQKVLKLEHLHYASIIENLLKTQKQ